MIRSLAQLQSIGPEFTTLPVREAFGRKFRSRRALGSSAGLSGTPFSNSGSEREHGISKAGNRRLRWQPKSALSTWFRTRIGQSVGRIKKIMIVALARKLLVALWRYVKDGLIPEGAKMKTA